MKVHAASAQIACEAAAAIRTVAALIREKDCADIYSRSLEEPLHASNRSSIWSSAIFAFCQGCVLWVTALVFWYGAGKKPLTNSSLLKAEYLRVRVSHQEYTVFEFFVGLMVSRQLFSVKIGQVTHQCSTFAAITAGTVLQNAPDLSEAKIAAENILNLVGFVPM